MAEKKEPQSFALVLEEADHGRINRILSNDLAMVVDRATTKASLHDSTWKGEIKITIKVVAEPHGKVELGFAKTVKIDEEKMPKARMYYDPDAGVLTTDTPKQVKISFGDDKHGAVKSASAPKGGAERN